MDAHSLTIAQSCPRRWRLEQSWKPRRWHPRRLFNYLLRHLILEVGEGKPADKVGESAAIAFLEQAGNPGLEFSEGSAVYDLSQDFAAALRVTAELVSRSAILAMRPGPTIRLADMSWRTTAFEDQAGCLHAWRAVERIDTDTITAIGHSWMWADSALAGVPLTLHLVAIGAIRNGHLHSDLCRTWQHPAVAKFQFRHKDGRKLSGEGWKAKWLQDMSRMTVAQWVDRLQEDNAVNDILRTIPLRQPSAAQAEEAERQITAEAKRLETLPLDWREIAMHRGACDRPVCPWQPLCYGPNGSTPESVGGYISLAGKP